MRWSQIQIDLIFQECLACVHLCPQPEKRLEETVKAQSDFDQLVISGSEADFFGVLKARTPFRLRS